MFYDVASNLPFFVPEDTYAIPTEQRVDVS